MRALVIEDDPQMARIVALELRHAGWEVTAAESGRAGLAEAIGHPPDAVLLDLTLPDIDGLEVCRTLRRVSDVPIVMLTARGDLAERVAGLDAGADDYLVKPFAPSELLARLRAVLRRGRSGRSVPEVLQFADLRLDPARREVRRGETPINLTRREFDLLAYMMENAGIVLTRDMILERVWGWGFAGSTNIVDVYVGYLRNKLDVDGRPNLIQTVRGVGYVLRESEGGEG
ncbi:MAG: response regulator transcription factor [Firmicutes bacterium]|nr:response regulator transcription factor [Bacillota bacterium]